MHPLHDIPLPDRFDLHFPTVIEIPRGSKLKYEIDKRTGLLMLDRVLYSSVHYPAHYGFIPQTHAGDGDPLDVPLLIHETVHPLPLLTSRPRACQLSGPGCRTGPPGTENLVVSLHRPGSLSWIF